MSKASEYVANWRKENRTRYLFQARVDNTATNIRKELAKENPSEKRLNRLYALLEKHTDNLETLKKTTYTKAQYERQGKHPK